MVEHGTALAPHLGPDNAVRVAQRAQADGSSLREAALACALLTPEQFDAWVWLEETRAVTPLGKERPQGAPETWPFGL